MEDRKISAVSRRLLENCANYTEGSASHEVLLWHKELRALLDADEAMHGQPADATHYWPAVTSSRKWRKHIGGVWHEWCGGKWLPLDASMHMEYLPCSVS